MGCPSVSPLFQPSGASRHVTATQHHDLADQAPGGRYGTSANATPGLACKQFIELCVNTGKYERQLAEIDVTDVESDSELFRRIREAYIGVRSFRARYFLLMAVDVQFIQVRPPTFSSSPPPPPRNEHRLSTRKSHVLTPPQFSLEDRHRVGILEKPMAIPGQDAMQREGYGYAPVPLTPPPVPHNIFMHHLLQHREGHTRLLWGNRIPKKLRRSIMQMDPSDADGLVTGWGIHIIEGLNRFMVLLCTLVILLFSAVVAVVWVVVRDDVQGGVGIGAWLTSVLAVVLMLVLTRWSEL